MVSAKDIVTVINEHLRTVWTDSEWKEGKRIQVLPEWKGRTKFVIGEYRKVGWSVKKEAVISAGSRPEVYMIFKNPESYKACPSELKDTRVR